MKDVVVPPPPVQEQNQNQDRRQDSEGVTADVASNRSVPLDAAFLGRIYRSMLWFGIVLTILVTVALKSAGAITSFVGGMLMAALLLRTQEVLVRAALRPKEQLGGMDARALLVIALPLKYIVVIGVLVGLHLLGLIRPAMLAVGFFVGQLVIVAKVLGWMASRRLSR